MQNFSFLACLEVAEKFVVVVVVVVGGWLRPVLGFSLSQAEQLLEKVQKKLLFLKNKNKKLKLALPLWRQV